MSELIYREAGGPLADHAVRLTFAYKGTEVHLIRQQAVEMTVPRTDSLEGLAALRGFWSELRDARDRTLFRRAMSNPIRADVEVFSDEPKQTLARKPVARPQGVFVVLVPRVAGANHVVLLSNPAPGQKWDEKGPHEIARVRLTPEGPATKGA